jgi:5-methylcytosine-specific restriction protein B
MRPIPFVDFDADRPVNTTCRFDRTNRMNDELIERIRTEYQERFIPAYDIDWRRDYIEAVQEVRAVSDAEFMAPEFQKRLWESDRVASAGMGNSVVITGAYADQEIAEALLALRAWAAPEDPMERARALDQRLDQILGMVTPRHNARKPRAKLTRLFVTLRPHDTLCLLDWGRTAQVRQWLQQPSYRLGLVGQHSIIRDALRLALGPEKSLEDDVLYSQFSWFLWDRNISPQDPETAEPAGEAVSGRATDTPRLSILPAAIQRKGLTYVSNNLAVLLSMVRAAENGIEKEDLIQQIGEEAPTLNHGSRSNVIAQAVSLGVITNDNGVYRPTAEGRALLEGTPPAVKLAPVLIRSVFGVAQILDDLRSAGPLERGQIASNCRQYYPKWTSDFSPNALVFWLRDLELADIEGVGSQARISLTEAGEFWASGLPANLKTERFLLTDERPDERPAVDPVAPIAPEKTFRAADFEDLHARFRANPMLKTLVFSKEQIGLIHAALHSTEGKRFVLLAGLSGAGKTSMARGYAEAYCEVLGLPSQSHYLQVAVWPDWTDPSGLLGYLNPLANPPIFQQTETLRFLLGAMGSPGKPFFLCLDEMNLARVEHYFAPFLSAMEGPIGVLAIHSGGDTVDAVPPLIPWPKNLFILGTVNMDETTHPFSDKVLDRAFTFEFWKINLEDWRAMASERADAAHLDMVFPALAAFYAAFFPARRHFGYRTCDEVLGFYTAAVNAGLGSLSALDAAVLAKILPKVRGDKGGALPNAIKDAITVCEQLELNETREKLASMQATLNELGAVRFWS